LGVGLTTLPCKKENCWEASKKLNRILWRRPRPKLGCGAKERKKEILGEKVVALQALQMMWMKSVYLQRTKSQRH